MKKYRVWFVDDMEVNRTQFAKNHGDHFDVRLFKTPDEVLRALETERPDALLCDVYFYPDEREAKRAEEKVHAKAEELRRLDFELGADKYAAGIALIERVRELFNGSPPFPLYAYTAKGPYLLHGDGFERLSRSGARWLFKGRYGPETERLMVMRTITEFEQLHDWRKWLWSHFWRVVVLTGLISAVLGVVFDRLTKRWLGF